MFPTALISTRGELGYDTGVYCWEWVFPMARISGRGKYGSAIEYFCGVWLFPSWAMVLPVDWQQAGKGLFLGIT